MLCEVGHQWALSDLRPRISLEMKKHWEGLVRARVESVLPMPIRKSGGVRGGIVVHRDGRKLVFADNSPAQWAFSRAFAECAYSLGDIGRLFEHDEIPFAFAAKNAEKGQMGFKCTLSTTDNVNKHGWKLCHIQEVGLNTRTPIADLPIETLKRHSCYLLMPANHFLIPLVWAGLGEAPEFIEEIRKVEGTSSNEPFDCYG